MGEILRFAQDEGVVPFPRDAQAAAFVTAEAYAMAADTANPEACWAWIAFLSEQIPTRLLPARQSLVDSTQFKRAVGDQVAAIVR